MKGVPYFPADSADMYHRYYTTQAGNGMKVFRGKRIMPGHGFGSFMKGLFTAAKPLLKSAGKKLLSTGAQIAQDALNGENFAESAKRNFTSFGSELAGDVVSTISGKSRKRQNSPIVRPAGTARRKKAKRARSSKAGGEDIFSSV